ncbi:MAG: bifunctional adenosylcobinamide kinase/adenosylcobinamide-phosphate guanylyltransferase [Pseudomonadota bacterium]
MNRYANNLKAARCFRFKTLEVPLKLETALLDLNHHRYVLLIDCLSVWLTNLIVKNGWQDQVQIKSHIIQLIDCIGASNANIVTISSEVGLSVIGIDAMTRAFIDFNGFMNQKLAKLAKDVFFVQAGLAQNIKSNSKH